MAFQLPNQKLTRAEKEEKYGSVKDWAIQCFKEIEKLGTHTYLNHSSYLLDIQTNYDLITGKLNMEDFNFVTKPYQSQNRNFKYPADFRHYDILTPKIEVLKGEEMKRPFGFNVVATNPEVMNDILDRKKEAAMNYINNQLRRAFERTGVLAPLEEPQEEMTPEEINEYFEYKYKHMIEKTANDVLQYLYKYQNLQDKFIDGFVHQLVSGAEIYWVGIVQNVPTCRNVDIRFFDYDRSPDTKFIEDAEWAREWRWMTISQVIDEFYDVLTDEDVKKLEDYKGTIRAHHTNVVGVPVLYSADLNNSPVNAYTYNSSSIVKVVRMEWKSRRKVGFFQYYDESGAILKKMVDESFKFDKSNPSHISIEWKWINEVWEATRLADDIFVHVGPKPHQHRSIDNYSECKLSYTGVVTRNPLVSRMKQIQYLYDIIMYRLELAFARAKGQTIIIDTASIPKSYGFDVERVLHHIDTSGVLFINSLEDAKSGPNAGKNPTFNQFTTMDLGPSSTIQAYLVFLQKLEELMSAVSGITPQREGAVQASETLGGVERAVAQSSFITEPFFYIHNRVKWKVLTRLLEESQVVWGGQNKALQYYTDDLTRTIINITGSEYQLAEFAVFVSDSVKDNTTLQAVRTMAEPMLQAGTLKMSDYFAIVESNSVSQAKQIMKTAEKFADMQRQEDIRLQQEAQQAQIQAQQAEAEINRNHELQMTQMNNETKLAIAQISKTFGRDATIEGDSNDNSVRDAIDLKKLDLQREQMQAEIRLKEKELEQERILKEKELEIKRKQTSKPK